MAIYPDSIAVEMQFSGVAGAWTDVTADVYVPDSIQVEYGMSDAAPTTRVADTGSMKFSLKNDASNSGGLVGYYTPGHANCRAGFQTGITVRLRVTYDSVAYGCFYGKIAPGGINVVGGLNEAKRVNVEVLDFMELAAVHEIYLSGMAEDKRIDEIVPWILLNMPIQPCSTLLNAGTDTYSFVGDTLKEKTRALTEFQKVAISELGYIYIVPDANQNEILVVEGRQTRNAIPAVASISLATSLSGYLLKEDGGKLLQETGDKIILNELTALSIDDYHVESVVSHGKYLANVVQTTAYPRSIDDEPVTLYSLPSPLKLASSDTNSGYKVNFRDPLGMATNVTGRNMITPQINVDYQMFSNEDGTGTDLTSYFSLYVEYGAQGAECILRNLGPTDGWITKMDMRGYGIYLYEPITYVTSSSTSTEAYGAITLTMDQKYQDDPADSVAVADALLAFYKDPETTLDEITYIANKDVSLMFAFLQIGLGKKVNLYDTIGGIDGDYFIQGKRFTIMEKNIIKFTWILKDAAKDLYAF